MSWPPNADAQDVVADFMPLIKFFLLMLMQNPAAVFYVSLGWGRTEGLWFSMRKYPLNSKVPDLIVAGH